MAPLEFQKWVVDTGWTNDNTCGPATLKPTVKNLIVSNVKVTEGTVDYFKWDPDAGGTLAAPVISFTIEDADPHTYDCAVYYRATSGSQTWEGNPYWAATQTVNAPGTVIFNLANAGLDGHLEPGVQDPGPYTFDIVVTEHDGAAQVDRYGYKEPYCLWVPTTTPETPPREGHRVWTKVPEEDGQAEELRAMYWLNHQWNQTPSDVELVVVDPTLSERPPTYVASADERALDVMHGGEDADSDGEADGIGVYTFADDDPSGLWRVVWTASDAVGPKTQHRRTHDEQRMLTANGKLPRMQFWLLLDPGHGYFYDADAELAVNYRGGWCATRRYVEADAVLDIAQAAQRAVRGMRCIRGASVSRPNQWDLGLHDTDPTLGSVVDTASESPRGSRSIDARVAWAKQEQAAHWANGYVPCVLLSLHTNGNPNPLARGAFLVTDPDQLRKPQSEELGHMALAVPRSHLDSAPDREEPLQLLHMASKILTEDRDRDGSAFEAVFQGLEAAEGRRRRIPSALLEVGHHSNTVCLDLCITNNEQLSSPAERDALGRAIAEGVRAWVRGNYDWDAWVE